MTVRNLLWVPLSLRYGPRWKRLAWRAGTLVTVSPLWHVKPIRKAVCSYSNRLRRS
jgi:hypothetical protein